MSLLSSSSGSLVGDKLVEGMMTPPGYYLDTIFIVAFVVKSGECRLRSGERGCGNNAGGDSFGC